ncbi:CHAT domain-containing protein [Aspergillus spinulosporus]
MESNQLFYQALRGLQDYEASDDREDSLNESIVIARQATRVVSNELFDWSLLLASCLRYKVRKAFAIELFIEAVRGVEIVLPKAKVAMQLFDEYLEHYINTLEILVDLYKCKYKSQGQLRDLDKSIAYMQHRIVETEKRSVPRMLDYINMSVLIGDRYDVSGETDNAMAGVKFAKAAESLAHGHGPKYKAEAAAAMGAALLKLCQGGIQLEESDPLDTAIAKIESAIELIPEVNKNIIQWQHNLATLLELQFERNPRMLILDRAIALSKTVVKAHAGNKRQKAIQESCLGNLFGRKFEWTGASEYLNNSIDWLREANSLLSQYAGCVKTRYFNNLAFALALRSLEDPERTAALFNLGELHCISSEGTDYNKALTYYKDAFKFQQGQVHIRLRAAQKVLEILQLREDWEQARAIRSDTLKLLPDLCEQSLTLHNQQYAVLQVTGLAADVCSLYFQSDLVTEALQKLEFGRGLILRYMINRQSNVPGLEKNYPDLAAEYKTLQRQMAQPVDHTLSSSRRQQLVQMRLEAGEKLKTVIQEIYQKEVFEAFLLEPKAEELTGSVASSVAVIVNMTPIRTDAIIVSSSQIRSVQLPKLKRDIDQWFTSLEYQKYRSMVLDVPAGHRDITTELIAEDNETILEWLWDCCVKPILNEISVRPDGSSRIWWIDMETPAPFHFPEKSDPIIHTFSQALSYSKSLSLNHSRSQKDTEKESVLIIAMPTTPGHHPLSRVVEECNIIRAICRETHVCEVLNHPTADQVCSKLATSDIVHFACHGSANETDPLQSYLLLQKDGVLDKLTVSRISNKVSQKSAWIAYLSACSTAQVRATNLANKSLHIASAFQMSGFPHVIGSLWPTDNAACIKVAEYFYTYLFNNNKTTVSNLAVASALRDAVLKVRSEISKHDLQRNPLVWAAYIHLSA